MTYLAISTNSGDPSALFAEEGARTAELASSGVIEKMWLKSDWSGSVMVLATADEDAAREVVGSLPITRAGLTSWAFIAVVEPPVGPPPGR